MDKKTVTIDTESLAHLSRLYLSKEELCSFGADMEDMVSFVSGLFADDGAAQDTAYDDNDPCRADDYKNEYEKDALLSVAPKVHDGFFAVPKVVE